jgi:DNA mismatch repair ATPase MutS
MTSYSILFETPPDRVGTDSADEPSFFADLNCDQIVAAITAGREEYDLAGFFYAQLRRVEAIDYRHEVMRDLDATPLKQRVEAFAQAMRDIRNLLRRIEKLHCREQRQALFLDAVELYCTAVRSLAQALAELTPRSRGFRRLRDELNAYAASSRFKALTAGVNELQTGLADIEYCVQIQGDTFTVRRYRDEGDYSKEVEATFEKFKQGAARDYRVKFTDGDSMNHVEAKILEFVGKLHPEVFLPLQTFCDTQSEFIDRTIAAFDREVQFYMAYLDYIGAPRRAGLQFCYPLVSASSKEVYDYDGFDIALAHKLIANGTAVVCNDFSIMGDERVLVVSGPNQGGKSTFARAFGQIHYLAGIGCPVPGREAQLFLFDRLHTHFEKEEKVENLRGRLEDDLIRIREILGTTTSQSIIVLNEIFTSTTIKDESFLSRKVLQRILELDVLCVWVTFVEELASFAPQTVSMVSTVVADNPAWRTFKIVRRPADGLAYATAIAQKHGLTADAIRKRLRS